MSPKIGRNDICDCGSGKKYKNCCDKAGFRLSRRTNQMLFGGVLLIGVLAIGFGYMNVGDLSAEDGVTSENETSTSTDNVTLPVTAVNSPTLSLTPQPVGDAPPGKIWSAEHGHWHDNNPNIQTESGTRENPIRISGNENIEIDPSDFPVRPSVPTPSQPIVPGQLTPQPAGTPPAGKIWSEEHGHWHDATRPAPAYGDKPSLTAPPGPAPPGKTWSAEHGHWHGPPNDADLNERVTRDAAEQGKVPYNIDVKADPNTKVADPK